MALPPHINSSPHVVERLEVLVHQLNLAVVRVWLSSQHLSVVEDLSLFLGLLEASEDGPSHTRHIFKLVYVLVLREAVYRVLKFSDLS